MTSLPQDTMKSQRYVKVIGAGVIGLTTAVRLLERGVRLEIYSLKYFFIKLSSTAFHLSLEPSNGYRRAGAQWRTHAAPSSEASQWDGATWRHWQTLLQPLLPSEYASVGVFPIKLTEYREVAASPTTPWWSALSSDFKHIHESHLPLGVATGTSMPSFVASPTLYLTHLLNRAKEMGARTHDIRLPSDKGLEGLLAAAKEVVETEGSYSAPPSTADVYVNATGLFAREFVPGEREKMIPVRGQTLLVRGEFPELITKIYSTRGDVLAVIPRVGTGTTVIGSTRGPGREDLGPDERETEWLLREGRSVAPDLFKGEEGRGEVVGVNVGLRPSRRGGARVELEMLETGEVVVHQYGHDGAGYQNSIGSAEKAIGLLGNFWEQGKS